METTTTETKSAGTGGGASQTSLLHSPRIHASLSLVLMLLAAFLFAQTINALREYRYIGGGVPSSNTVSVMGEGELFVRPDAAEFTVSVIQEGETAAAVRDAADAKITAVTEAFKAEGVEEADIKNIAYELQPKYEWQPVTCVRYPCDRKQVQKGFTLTQSLQVKVRALDKAGTLVSLASEKGASTVSGVTFTLADKEAKMAEARTLAIKNAQEKAKVLAGDLQVTLARVVGYYEESNQPVPYMARSYAEGMGGDMAAAMPKEAALPVGENQIISRVTVMYEIR